MELTWLSFAAFAVLGVVIGTFGTLIGVGGGFLLIPVLLWLYPEQPAETIASISLAIVFFNALSGSIAYARMKRIDYRSGFLFAAAALPGTVIGALVTAYIPRQTFDVIIGVALALAAGAIFLRTRSNAPVHGREMSGSRRVVLTDSSGAVHEFAYRPWLGAGLSTVVGFLSSMLGIGGGIIHVPALVHLLNFPVHIATATSHFMLAIMACGGSLTHLFAGELQKGIALVVPLASGVIAGAQLGAKLSNRLRGLWIMRSLAIALLFVGLRLIWNALR